ncbi:MAG: polyisoprenoid-binding protein [Alphaproteobacteria bacterium]|nr:polyisoprenoid-binding protein [Alphaproteobacteria bacterium]NCQ88634.1 polyisoprenoid-binding protein [Alphaproteobacteria bacterium]NCT06177.1 polyisoprenoid-binding protein [Alphaproteobacteria bacterium]
MKYLLMALAFFAVSIAPAKAEVEDYDFDKAHTQILFFVDHLGFSKSQGEFHEYDGMFSFNRSEPEKSSVEISIQTNSIDMDDKKWNEHMKNEDFFNVEKFPTMNFKSTAIELTGDNTAKLTGDLTILETTKPVTLDVIFNKAAKHPFNGKYVAGFSAKTKIKRSDFEMNYGLPLVGDEVDIMIEVEGVRRGGDVVNQ